VSHCNVLDASALLAVFKGEAGWQTVLDILPFSMMSTVNVSEAVAKSVERNTPPDFVKERFLAYQLEIVPFDAEMAFLAGNLRSQTKAFGLSFGDRACLALAIKQSLPVITADRIWAKLDIGVEVRLIR
jgi:ribonuclease VapC